MFWETFSKLCHGEETETGESCPSKLFFTTEIDQFPVQMTELQKFVYGTLG